MPLYSYKGYNSQTGQAVKGTVESDSLKSARAKLRQKDNIMTSELKEESGLTKTASKMDTSFLERLTTKTVKVQDTLVMTRQLATLVSAHVPIDDALKALVEQVSDPVLRQALSQVKDRVNEGKSLAESLAAFPGIFNKLYVNMVKAGYESGRLGLVLNRLAEFMEYQLKIKNDVFSALTYPGVMISVSFAVITYLFVSVVPKLQKVFASLKATLPWYTQFLIDVSNFIQSHWLLLLMIGVASGVLFEKWVKTPAGRRKFDRFSLEVPVFGGIFLALNVSRFTRTLSTLMDSGVQIVPALEITKNIIGNVIISDVIEQAKIAVQEGKSLGLTLEKSGEFPPIVSHMVKTGEKTGSVETMLNHVAIAYDAEVERKIGAMVSLIEPAMIVVMGGIVVVVVIAMMVPMLGLMSQVR